MQLFDENNDIIHEKEEENIITDAINRLLAPKSFMLAKEFACKDGTDNILIDSQLIETLEKIRNHFGAPITINSGFRTVKHNRNVGGAKASYHCKGMAADIVVKGHSPKEVAKYADSILEKGGVIRYTNFVHIDIRESKYRKGV